MSLQVILLVVLGLIAIAQTVFLFILMSRTGQKDSQAMLGNLSAQNERMEKGLRDEFARQRDESLRGSRELRDEVAQSLKIHGDSNALNAESLGQRLTLQMSQFSETQSQLTRAIETKLTQIQDSNTRKLEEMRQTVDEKLQGTLEKRLGESFKIVSDRLDQVHRGLGEMQTLAIGVGDLKRVLTNVKTRGVWGEIMLRGILEQMLLPSQFEANVNIKPDTQESVEFAVRLPGDDDKPVWLPIDAKFPKEDYERILEAQDLADVEGLRVARDGLSRSLKVFAKKIRDLYINPPRSTDFAILFLPTEGLFAEVCQMPGLIDFIQREYRVTVAGPTTMAALLNSLQMGFQTLAIQERSSEVWEILGAVKTEFGRYGTLLEAVDKKLDEAKNKIASVRSKSTTIHRKLRNIEELPHAQGELVLGLKPGAVEEPDEDDEAETPTSV